ncbi:type VI secretion system contractile sheath large subunit [Saccharophagus degradans]|uniref:Type VI secretion system contractile sheath large subunit n=1 Tax=Saccharophagus degradans (strain 2-40 / ATCC 43961 / DSM 17024) TaxID=203122 RepID=Q21KI6_SACD2|nr:type VI secretion system contractile sheath large subunit [Saccharophagus degradans]ABD80793.1 protein of unknown function DUF877 [Saccharophagus degradans 2-40]
MTNYSENIEAESLEQSVDYAIETPEVEEGGIPSLLLHCFNSASNNVQDSDIDDWVYRSLVTKNITSKDAAIYLIEKTILEIDKILCAQIDEILHHERFRALEASWRGVIHLIDTQSDYDEELTVKIKVLNVGWKEVGKDLARAIEFDQSQLFQRIYSDEFDTPGGEPFGVLLGDYYVSHRHRAGSLYNDLDTLKELANIATAALCPFITGAHASLFGLDSAREMGYPIDLQAVFKQKEYLRWKSLRQTESTRFVGLTLPEMLMREPYRADGTRAENFNYNERTLNADSDYVWGNACFAFGSVLIRAFANTGWFADIRGGVHEFGEGGVVRGMRYSRFETDISNNAAQPTTKLQIDDYLERELSDLGFIPMCSYFGSEISAFYSNSSLHDPAEYTTEIAKTNARLSAMIQYMLCVSRFGHYLKVIGRDRIGSIISAQDCQRVFQNWLNQYTTSSEGASNVLKARYPLSESRVEIHEQPGRIGYFTCVVHLKPHFQLDQLVSSIKLVTELAVGTVGSQH